MLLEPWEAHQSISVRALRESLRGSVSRAQRNPKSALKFVTM